MHEVAKENRKIESKLRDSEAQLFKIQEQKSNLQTNSASNLDNGGDWIQMKKRSEMLDHVVKERDVLKVQLCQMVGISDVLHKLKCRADQADEMEQEIIQLRRDLQRSGAAGDEIPKKRLDSACKQCHAYAEELERSESNLEAEIKKNCATEAERNFLLERCRTIDVMQAEFILYKVKSFVFATNILVIVKNFRLNMNKPKTS